MHNARNSYALAALGTTLLLLMVLGAGPSCGQNGEAPTIAVDGVAASAGDQVTRKLCTGIWNQFDFRAGTGVEVDACARIDGIWHYCNAYLSLIPYHETVTESPCSAERTYACTVDLGQGKEPMQAGACRNTAGGALRCQADGTTTLEPVTDPACDAPDQVGASRAYEQEAYADGALTRDEACAIANITGDCYVLCQEPLHELGGSGLGAYHDPSADVDLNGIPNGTCFRYEARGALASRATAYMSCSNGLWHALAWFDVLGTGARPSSCPGGFIDLFGGATLSSTPCMPGDACWPRD